MPSLGQWFSLGSWRRSAVDEETLRNALADLLVATGLKLVQAEAANQSLRYEVAGLAASQAAVSTFDRLYGEVGGDEAERQADRVFREVLFLEENAR